MTSVERFGGTPVADEGTPESRWVGHTSFRSVDLRSCRRLLVVAPHPDDEILGVGGMASALAMRGIPVSTLSVTDGEASHPGSPTLSRRELAARRRTESDSAAALLGLSPPLRLALPDGAVAECEEALVGDIRTRLDAQTWCAAPLRNDGHPDHEAVGRAAARAAAAAGATLIEYPIWLWHWSFPADPVVPWSRARSFALPAEQLRAKAAAVREFVTQVAPLSQHPADRAVLPPHVLARLLRPHETVFVP